MSIPSRKRVILEAYKNGLRRCPCCGVQMVWQGADGYYFKNLATVDHIVPRSQGGANHSGNLFVMCRTCNHERDTQCFVEFLESKGIARAEALELFKNAIVQSMKSLILSLFLDKNMPKKSAKIKAGQILTLARKTLGEMPQEFIGVIPYNSYFKIG